MENVLEVICGGCGGIADVRACFDDAAVQWALFRVDFGSGSFQRQKTIFLHMNGENCPPVARGRANQHTGDVQRYLCGPQKITEERFHVSVEVTTCEDVTEEYVLERVRRYFIIDNLGDVSPAWFSRTANPSEPAYGRKASEPSDLAADKERRIRMPSHESERLFESGREALMSVAEAVGIWNWLLIGPDPQALPLICGGEGSVDEMREYLTEHDEEVLFGLLRVGFGEGRLRRVKHVFIHAIGARVPAVRRGRWNASRASMEQVMYGFVHCALSLQITDMEDLTPEAVVCRIRQKLAVDDDILAKDLALRDSLTVDAFRVALKEERAARQAKAAEAQQKRRRSYWRNRRVEDVLKLVHSSQELNWAVFGLRALKPLREKPSAAGGGIQRGVCLSRPTNGSIKSRLAPTDPEDEGQRTRSMSGISIASSDVTLDETPMFERVMCNGLPHNVVHRRSVNADEDTESDADGTCASDTEAKFTHRMTLPTPSRIEELPELQDVSINRRRACTRGSIGPHWIGVDVGVHEAAYVRNRRTSDSSDN